MDYRVKNDDREFGFIYSITFSHATVASENEHKFQCQTMSKKENPSEVKKIVVTHNEEGAVFFGDKDAISSINDCIIIRNRKTNSVRLFLNKHFQLFPYLISKNKYLPTGVKNIITRSITGDLNKILGSKKIKRQLAQSEKTDVNISNIEKSTKKAIEQNELTIDTEIITKFIGNEIYLPPSNRNAKLVDQVYTVEDLVSHDILFELEGLAGEIMQADASQLADDSRFSPFFSKAIAQISRSLLKVKLLLFADSLVKFLRVPARTLKSKTPIICSYSSAINQEILNEFCVQSMSNIKIRTPSMRDKALCYILVILLIICEFTVDISVLSGNVSRTEYNRLPMLMKAVGARVGKSTPTVFHLKLPLSRFQLNKGKIQKK